MNVTHSQLQFKRIGTTVRLLVVVAVVATLAHVESAAAEGTQHALIVATRDYPNASNFGSLPGTNRDAERFQRSLVRSGFAERNTTLVYDDAKSEFKLPNKANILLQLDDVLGRVQEDDTVIVTATGHGIVLNGTSYYVPQDVSDQVLKGDVSRLISVMDIADRLSKCPAANKLLVIDACRDKTYDPNGDFVELLQRPPKGVWLMSSCSEGEFSFTSHQLEQGESHAVFSYFLSNGLTGEADLLGNNNGQVSLLELYSYTFVKTQAFVASQIAARDNQDKQTPELFVGVAAPFQVGSVKGFVATPDFQSSDPDVERRQSALLLADRGNQHVREAEQAFQEAFRLAVEQGVTVPDESIYRDHHNLVSYAMGNFLQPAIQLDPECRTARVARGWSFRACAMYAAALEEFVLADEHFDLYVRGRAEDLDAYFETMENGRKVLRGLDEEASKEIADSFDRVVLRYSPSADGPTATTVAVNDKLRVSDVLGSDTDSEQWLFVTAVNDQPLDSGGWIERGNVHWFAEAADFYTPTTPMSYTSGGSRAATTFARLDQTSRNLSSLATRLEAPVVPLRRAREMFSVPAQRINRINRFLGPLGYSIPNYPAQAQGYIGVAESYALIPSNTIRTAAGYAQLPESYARPILGWTDLATGYQGGMQRAEYLQQETNRRIVARSLEAVREDPIRLKSVLWRNRK